jgi:UDP-N-acetylmuramyl pentapeptide phosphotransferase/UDP-N-acetylglucosamine-1-phosphate transferase
MVYDLATMSLIFLALWAAAAAFLIWNAKPAVVLPPVKNPVGFMPPPA